MVELRLLRLVTVAPRSDPSQPLKVTLTDAGRACYHNYGRISGLQPFKDLAMFDAYLAAGGELPLDDWMAAQSLSEERQAALREIIEPQERKERPATFTLPEPGDIITVHRQSGRLLGRRLVERPADGGGATVPCRFVGAAYVVAVNDDEIVVRSIQSFAGPEDPAQTDETL
jgi:hypothetical protein